MHPVPASASQNIGINLEWKISMMEAEYASHYVAADLKGCSIVCLPIPLNLHLPAVLIKLEEAKACSKLILQVEVKMGYADCRMRDGLPYMDLSYVLFAESAAF